MAKSLRTLVVGAGNMGASHARAYKKLKGFEICGVVTRSEESRNKLIDSLGGGIKGYGDYDEALADAKPDCVSINTYPETHAEYTLKAFKAGAHVFLEKPVAVTVEEAQSVVDAAKAANKKLVVGYILRVHPSWIKFIEIAQTMGIR